MNLTLDVKRDILIPLGLLVILAGVMFLVISPLASYLGFVAGLLLGLVLLLADITWLYRYYTDVNDEPYIISRSLLFSLVFIPLSLFMVTSSGSSVGIGMMLGMNTVISYEMWSMLNNPDAFKQVFLRELKVTFTESQLRKVWWVSVGWLGILLLLIIL